MSRLLIRQRGASRCLVRKSTLGWKDCTRKDQKAAMNYSALNDSTAFIEAGVRRIQARCLDEAFEMDSAKKIDILVETLDVHGQGYLQQVNDAQAISTYIADLRRIGKVLILNAEERSFLLDPYSDAKLRRIAESSGDFIMRRASLSAAHQEQVISDKVALIREEVRPKAQEWDAWKTEMVFEIERRFEARYLHWEAEAIDRVHASRAKGTLPSAGSEIGTDGTQSRDRAAKNEEQRATSWQHIRISFRSDERVQIRVGTQLETRNYGELGFEDRRNGKPNRAWIRLRMFAQQRGILLIGKSSREARVKLEKDVEEIRKRLRATFGLPGDPVPLVSGAYTAVFKIEWASCAEF
jgi:hypothetical protein